MIVGLLANKVALSPKLVNSLIRSVAEVARKDVKESTDLLWLRLSLMALINLVQVIASYCSFVICKKQFHLKILSYMNLLLFFHSLLMVFWHFSFEVYMHISCELISIFFYYDYMIHKGGLVSLSSFCMFQQLMHIMNNYCCFCHDARALKTILV